MNTRVLFINSIDSSKEIETRYPPLGIGYLISSIRRYFGKDKFEFRVINSMMEEEINSFKPHIIGISSTTQNYNRAIDYAKIAKSYELPVICGGVHITMLPSSLTKDMDIGVIGEGEKTICDLLNLFLEKNSFMANDLQKINGITYWNDSASRATTEKRELINPLDKIDQPARDVFDIGENTYMFTSRGCPYRCTFCASSRFWDKVRLFSAEYVANEIQFLYETYGVKTISFYDDIFSIDEKRVRNILNLLKSRGIWGKVGFTCAIRANLVNDKLIELLKELGVHTIGMGLESGCDETLKYLKKDNISLSDNERAVKIIRKHKIPVMLGTFIIGSPIENEDSIMQTLRFIKKSKLDDFEVYVLTPFPGTPVWEYAKDKGLVNEAMNWDTLNVNFEENHDAAVILSEKLTREDIWRLFLKFKRYRKWQRIPNLLDKGLKNPYKIPIFLFRKSYGYLSKQNTG
jgi:anaerobic magnesium-protoporphyrin IX monomethyl ester cyclase